MAAPCFLYGSHASYATAKTRAYLRKKGIPFVERLPAHPRFRSHVRPSSGLPFNPRAPLPTAARACASARGIESKFNPPLS